MVGPEFPIRRILVALDATTPIESTIQIAGEMAAQLQAELHALFVEDLDLLHSAALPFVKQSSLQPGMPAEFDEPTLEGELRARADAARHRLSRVASQCRVHWSFRVVRGAAHGELEKAAPDMDLIVLPGPSGPLSRGPRVSARSLTQTTSVLLVVAEPRSAETVLLLHDGRSESARALAAALRIASARGFALDVALVSSTGNLREQIRQDVERVARAVGVPIRFHAVPHCESNALCQIAQRINAGAVVLPADNELACEDCLRQLGRPLFLVR